MLPVKIVPKVTYYMLGGTLNHFKFVFSVVKKQHRA